MVYDCLEIWQVSFHLCATQKEFRTQNRHLTAGRYILDMEMIVKASWSLFQHDGAAVFNLSERSPVPPALSAKDLPGEQTQILNVHLIRTIKLHPVGSDEDSPPESISDTNNWPNSNGDMHTPNESEDDCAADDESDIEPNNGIEDPECLEQQDVSAAPNLPGLLRPTQKS
jgi:hypothetical protein